jgi:F-box-like
MHSGAMGQTISWISLYGKCVRCGALRLLFTPSLSAALQNYRSGQSIAQWCPDDILYIVFSQIPLQDTARAALVCKRWLHAGRKRLYANLEFNLEHPRSELLALTLETSETIRSYIVRLSLTNGPRTDGIALVDWLLRMPSEGLWALDINQYATLGTNFNASVLRCPALGPIQHLALCGQFLDMGPRWNRISV